VKDEIFASALSHTGVLGGGRHCRLSVVVVVGTVAGEVVVASRRSKSSREVVEIRYIRTARKRGFGEARPTWQMSA
jgi:ribosomal protein S5